MSRLLPAHWREYGAEALGLGLFMVSACTFGVLLFHPGSAVVQAIPDPFVRRALMGLAMALTALGNIHAPWGKRSGAHLNPAVTLAFLRLGRVSGRDAAWYVGAQFAGGLAGTLLAAAALGAPVMHPEVHYVATLPGRWGEAPAFAAEFLISAGLMLTVLVVSGHERWRAWTGLAAATLVALYITFEAPVSGMSMNPARTLGSALPAHDWRALWLYFVAPTLGMLTAATVFSRRGRAREGCAKLDHDPRVPCIFCEHRRHRAS